MPKAFQTKVITANDLVEGDSVFLGRSGWVREVSEARIAETAEEADILASAGRLAEADDLVVGAYLVDVTVEAGRPVPVSRRERIRAAGQPTFAYAKPAEAGVARAA